MKLRFLILCLSAFAFVACSNDDSSDSSDKKLPLTMEWVKKDGKKQIYNYKYDNLNRLTEYKVTDGTQELSKFIFSYSNSGEVNKLEEYSENILSRTHEFTYDGSIIIAKRDYPNGDSFNDNIQVDADNRMTESVFIDKTGNYKYTYKYDIKGNITSALFYKDNVHDITDDRKYDNKKGMLSAINIPLWVFTYLEKDFTFFCGANNLVSYIRTGNYDGATPETVLSISYDYDNVGYPTKFTTENEVVNITYIVVE